MGAVFAVALFTPAFAQDKQTKIADLEKQLAEMQKQLDELKVAPTLKKKLSIADEAKWRLMRAKFLMY